MRRHLHDIKELLAIAPRAVPGLVLAAILNPMVIVCLVAMAAPMLALWAGVHFSGSTAIFYALAFFAVVPALGVVVSQDIVRAAFLLLTSLASFAGFYLLLGADFLAVIQVLVYMGGIMMLILFGVMLTARDPVFVARQRNVHLMVPGLVSGLIILGSTALVVLNALPDRHLFDTVTARIRPDASTAAAAPARRGGAIAGDGIVLAVPTAAAAGAGSVTVSTAHDLSSDEGAVIGPAVAIGLEGTTLGSDALLVLPFAVHGLDPAGEGGSSLIDVAHKAPKKDAHGDGDETPAEAPGHGDDSDAGHDDGHDDDGDEHDGDEDGHEDGEDGDGHDHDAAPVPTPARSGLVIEATGNGRFVVFTTENLVRPEVEGHAAKTHAGQVVAPVDDVFGGAVTLPLDFADETLAGAVVAVSSSAVRGTGRLIVKTVPGASGPPQPPAPDDAGEGHGKKKAPLRTVVLGSGLEVTLEGAKLREGGTIRVVIPYDGTRLLAERDRGELRIWRTAGEGTGAAIEPRTHAVITPVSEPGVYQPVVPFPNTAREIGTLFLTDYILPFEIASVLLLVALVGAAFIARKHRVD